MNPTGIQDDVLRVVRDSPAGLTLRGIADQVPHWTRPRVNSAVSYMRWAGKLVVVDAQPVDGYNRDVAIYGVPGVHDG